MDNKIKVSVIITTFKRPRDVLRAIQSCIQQTLKEIEIIVVDDNDPESEYREKTSLGVQELVKTDPRVIYIQHKMNMNGSVARNTGIKASHGEYISFLDDDDYYLPDKLEVEYSAAIKLPDEYAGVMCNYYVKRHGKTIGVLNTDNREQDVAAVLACSYSMGSGSNLFVRRDVVNEIGCFDETLLRHQDLDFLVRVFEKYKIHKLCDPLFVVELFSSHLNIPNFEKLLSTKALLYKKYKSLISSLPHEKKDLVFGSNYMKLYEAAIANRKYKTAWKYYKKSTRFSCINGKRKFRMLAVLLYSFMPVWFKKLIKKGR